MSESTHELQVWPIRALVLVKPMLDELRFAEIVDDTCPIAGQGDLSHGQVAEGLVNLPQVPNLREVGGQPRGPAPPRQQRLDEYIPHGDGARDFEGLVVMRAGAAMILDIGVQVAQDTVATAEVVGPALLLTNLQVRLRHAPGVGCGLP